MTLIPRSHPRYRSLLTRAALAQKAREGLLAPEGLIAHGRGEAFDYLLGERSPPEAREATRLAVACLLRARCPVLSVNGNVAALASKQVAKVARALPHLRIEVNLFHRTPARAERVAEELRRAGVREVLGVHPTARLRGLPSDRGWVDTRGILRADVVVIPLEDGDRAEALRRAGKFVISIDLNPLSRTTLAAHIPIIDELTRVMNRVPLVVRDLRARPSTQWPRWVPSTAQRLRSRTLQRILERLDELSRAGSTS